MRPKFAPSQSFGTFSATIACAENFRFRRKFNLRHCESFTPLDSSPLICRYPEVNKTGTYSANGDDLPGLARGRVHEVSGASGDGGGLFGAAAFAMLMAFRGDGSPAPPRDRTTAPGSHIVVCAPPGWLGALHPECVAAFGDPNAVLHVASPLEGEILWAGETALRSGAATAVVMVTARSPGLTAFRRLQLAARAGRAIGLVLTDRPAASTAAETRWHCRPQLAPRDGEIRLHASLYKNKRGLVGSWVIDVRGQTHSLYLDAAPAGEPVRPDRIAG